MKQDVIKAVIIDFREHDLQEPTFAVREIRNTLSNLQAIVGGNIEIPYISQELAEMGIDMIINEEGKLEDLRTSILIVDEETDKIIDEIKGNVVFASHNEEGETISLNDKQIDYLEKNIHNNVAYSIEEGVVYVLSV